MPDDFQLSGSECVTLARSETEQTIGRSIERWFAIKPKKPNTINLVAG
jgi:hypothetical protein